MQRDEIRLECLKLAHAQGREIPKVIERAQAYEEYILKDTKDSSKGEVKNSQKKLVRDPATTLG